MTFAGGVRHQFEMRLLTLSVVLLAIAPAGASAQTTAFGDADGVVRLPEAVAVTPDGTVLVGDHGSGRIQRFAGARPAGSIGMRGRTCGRFGAIGGVAAGRDGRVYVVDTDRSRIAILAADGTLQRCFGGRGTAPGKLRLGSGTFAGSTATGGIAVTRNAVYVADTNNDRVQRFTLEGRRPKVLGRGRLDRPQGLAVRGHRLVVADDGTHRVVELTTGGRFVRAVKAGLRFPYDVALAVNGDAFVVDNNGHRVVRLDRRLRRKRSFGAGRLTFPRALALRPGGNVVVADAANDRLVEFTPDGGFVRTFGIDGRARPRLSAPADVSVNRFGEIAVADANARISWYDLTGRFLGAWAQGRSFQSSTATVQSPGAVAFAGPGALRVVDGGGLRQFSAGGVDMLLDGSGEGPGAVVAVDVAVLPDGSSLVLTGRGEVATVPAAGGAPGPRRGTALPRHRSAQALAPLPDGSVAVVEGPTEQAVRPPDGTVRRLGADGRLLSTWTVARPRGGEPTRLGGVESDGSGGVWVSDTANDRVLHLDATGTPVLVLGRAGRGPGELIAPGGLVRDCAGGLVVADTGGSRVQRFGGLAPATGCDPKAGRTVEDGPPRAIGLSVRLVRRARAPERALATFRVRCARRPCTITAQGSGYVLGRGRPRSVRVRASRDGSLVRLTAGPAALRALRTRGAVMRSVVVQVEARSRDGIVDRAAQSLRF